MERHQNNFQAWALDAQRSLDDGSYAALLGDMDQTRPQKITSINGDVCYSIPNNRNPLETKNLAESRELYDQMGWAKRSLSYIEHGLTLAYTQPIHPYVRRFVNIGVEVAGVALRDGPFLGAGGRGRDDNPAYDDAVLALANAKCEFSVALGRPFLHGGTIAPSIWRNLSETLVTMSNTAPNGYRGFMDQSKYLFGIVCALHGDDVETAQALLKPKKGFKVTAIFHSLVKDLTSAIVQFGNAIPTDEPVRAKFSYVFDAWRRPVKPNGKQQPDLLFMPQPSHEMFSVCLAIFADKYLVAPREFSWQNIFCLIVDSVD